MSDLPFAVDVTCERPDHSMGTTVLEGAFGIESCRTSQDTLKTLLDACSVACGMPSVAPHESSGTGRAAISFQLDTAAIDAAAVVAESHPLDRDLLDEFTSGTRSLEAALQQERLLIAELDRIRSERFRLHAGLTGLQRRLVPEQRRGDSAAASLAAPGESTPSSSDSTHRRRYQQLRTRVRELEQQLTEMRTESGALREMVTNAKAESELLAAQRHATSKQAEAIQRAANERLRQMERELQRVRVENEQLRAQGAAADGSTQGSKPEAGGVLADNDAPLRVVRDADPKLPKPSEPSEHLRRVFSRLRSA